MLRVFAALLITATFIVAESELAIGRDAASPIPMRGSEKWVSVGDLKGSALHLDARSNREVTAGRFTFPAGKLPTGSRRTYIGVTIATVKIRPASEVKSGQDLMWSQVGGWAYGLLSVKRTGKGGCPNAVEWSAGGILSGPQGGIDCDGVIRFRTVNELPYGSVRPGSRRWSFNLESLRKKLIESVRISPRSKLGITQRTPSNIRINAPRHFELPDGEESSVEVRIKNRGGRPARGLKVRSWVDSEDLPFGGYDRVRKLPPLGPGKSRKVRIPVAAIPQGTYLLSLAAGGTNGYGDRLTYKLVVGSSESKMSSSIALLTASP